MLSKECRVSLSPQPITYDIRRAITAHPWFCASTEMHAWLFLDHVHTASKTVLCINGPSHSPVEPPGQWWQHAGGKRHSHPLPESIHYEFCTMWYGWFRCVDTAYHCHPCSEVRNILWSGCWERTTTDSGSMDKNPARKQLQSCLSLLQNKISCQCFHCKHIIPGIYNT